MQRNRKPTTSWQRITLAAAIATVVVSAGRTAPRTAHAGDTSLELLNVSCRLS